MKEEEAINCIDDILESTIQNDETLDYQLSSFDFDWLEKAKAALEKQILKKPIKESLADRLCPICLSYLSFDALNDDVTTDAPNFCNNCGQAIDWEEEVEK